MQEQVFYYRFRKLNRWLLLNVVLTALIIYGFVGYPILFDENMCCWLILTGFLSWFGWGYKYLLKHRMALVTDTYIAIDRCRPLMWKDVQSAREKAAWCWFKRYRVIVLQPKENLVYRYNFLQKHNCGFTPFSIPLYGVLSQEDEARLTQIVKTKVKKFN